MRHKEIKRVARFGGENALAHAMNVMKPIEEAGFYVTYSEREKWVAVKFDPDTRKRVKYVEAVYYSTREEELMIQLYRKMTEHLPEED